MKYVVIGGFTNSSESLEVFCKCLSEAVHTEVLPVPLIKAILNKMYLKKHGDGSFVIAHSAGLVALCESGAKPLRVIANAPPVPIGLRAGARRALIARSGSDSNLGAKLHLKELLF